MKQNMDSACRNKDEKLFFRLKRYVMDSFGVAKKWKLTNYPSIYCADHVASCIVDVCIRLVQAKGIDLLTADSIDPLIEEATRDCDLEFEEDAPWPELIEELKYNQMLFGWHQNLRFVGDKIEVIL